MKTKYNTPEFARKQAALSKWIMGGFLMLALTPHLYASTATGLPWEDPLNKVKDSLTGPVATALGLIAFFVAGAVLIFGGELGDWTKRIVYVVMVMSLLLLGNKVITTLFSGAGLTF